MENIKKTNFLQFLIFSIPFSIALGNLATNLNILLIIILGLYRYKFGLFSIEKNLFNISLFSFFLFIILT